MKKTVLLAMSGGIDSLVAAVLLNNCGYDVKGITFLFSQADKDSEKIEASVKKLAAELDIPHTIADLRKKFDEVVGSYFRNSYIAGLTPFPCAVCNPLVKFTALTEYANQYNCNYIATGHYAEIIDYQSNRYISAGLDPDKDQSFFLWGLDGETRNRLILPVGTLLKKQVKEIAKDNSFGYLAAIKESTGMCFTGGKNYREFLLKTGINSEPGDFIDVNGHVLGTHKGIMHYTVGQRRGLNLQMNRPLFVKEIRLITNQVVLADYDCLYRNKIYLKDTKFVNVQSMNESNVYKVRIRYRGQESRCRIRFHDEQKAEVELLEPVAMVAPGQTAVIYEEGRVLGGGFIEGSA